ncbi:Hypothetical protein PROPJV5_2576, partial [Propionibacterium ruminifibrarum]
MTVIDDELGDPQPGARGQGCVSVRHKRAFLTVDDFAIP